MIQLSLFIILIISIPLVYGQNSTKTAGAKSAFDLTSTLIVSLVAAVGGIKKKIDIDSGGIQDT
jgi:hypothetical protein